ncbi:MAG: hypothetical protein U0835_25915 [Isosphaeraceae bacterium]
MSADASGVYLVGITFDALPDQVSSGQLDNYVRKYDGSGNLLWTRQFGSAFDDYAYDVATDASGVYVVGEAGGTLPGQVSSGGYFDAYVRKYDGSGNLLWTRQFGCAFDDGAYGVAADASGVYVVGAIWGVPPGHMWSEALDDFVRKYDGSGNLLWTREFGSGGGDSDTAVAAVPSGVYVVGITDGALPGQVWSGNNDAFLVKLTNTLDMTVPQTAVDLDGTVGVGGSFAGPVTVTFTPIDPDDTPAALTTIYSLDGGAPQTYAAPFVIAPDGVHTLTYQSRDPAGNLEALHTLTVIISTPTPLAVAETVINGGAAQRSNVETVVVRFNHPTNLPQLIASGSVSGAVRLVDAGGGAITMAPSRYRYNELTNVLTVDLTADGFGGSRMTMLKDRRYRLLLDTAAITSLVSPANHLVDDDGVADSLRQVAFSQLLGDYNGDGVVGLDDRSALLSHFGQTAATSADAYLYDLDGNGVVNLADYLLWARRVGLIV